MSALDRFNECVTADDEPMSPLERLRAFCSFAMSGQDWLDVEPFFAACESAWQPIASAPKDGTHIIAYRPTSPPHIEGMYWVTYDGLDQPGAWHWSYDGDSPREYGEMPTLWMPIPTEAA